MTTPKVFVLQREPTLDGSPARLSIGRTGASLSTHGIAQVTGAVTSLAELEGSIDRLKRELDDLREEARRGVGFGPRPAPPGIGTRSATIPVVPASGSL